MSVDQLVLMVTLRSLVCPSLTSWSTSYGNVAKGIELMVRSSLYPHEKLSVVFVAVSYQHHAPLNVMSSQAVVASCRKFPALTGDFCAELVVAKGCKKESKYAYLHGYA